MSNATLQADTARSATPEPTGATARTPWRANAPMWLLCGPALVLFATLVLVPLAMTFALTFYRFDPSSGPIAAFQFGNYVNVLSSSYYQTIFMRTFGIAAITTVLWGFVGDTKNSTVLKTSEP